MKSKTSYIEENLFGCYRPSGTAQENYDGFISEWGIDGLKMSNGYKITVEDIQEYFDTLELNGYPLQA
jgi:hypothetical protein